MVKFVAYSPDGRHIISGSWDQTVRIWDVKIGTSVSRPLGGETASMVYSPDRQHIDSTSDHNTTRVSESSPPEPPSSSNPLHVHFFSRPDSRGWIRGSDGGLLYWVPLDCRNGLHSPAPITIPVRLDQRPVSLDFEDFAYGTDWTQIFYSAQG